MAARIDEDIRQPDPRRQPPSTQPGPAPLEPGGVFGHAPASHPELLAAMPTDELRRLRNALRSHIPSDPTFAAAVSRVLGHLLDLDLRHPDRRARDEEIAARQAEERKRVEAEQLAAKHDAEKAALPAPDASPEAERQHRELAEKQAAEARAIERRKRVAELEAEQARERDEFARHQQEARNQALADDEPDPSAPQWEPPDRSIPPGAQFAHPRPPPR